MTSIFSRVTAAGSVALVALGLAGCAALPPIAGTPDASSGATATASAPAPVAVPSSALAPRKVDGGWQFSYRGAAQSVALAGDFNAWSTSANPLTKGTGDVWSIVVPLTAGDHQYKFVVNGSDWKPDPENPKSSDDGYGGKNSMVHVD